RQVVRQVDVLDFVMAPQRAHALRTGGSDGRDQQAEVRAAASERIHQGYRGIDLPYRHRVQPQRAPRVRRAAVTRVAFMPSLEIGRLAEATPDQVVDRDRHQQV